MGSGSIHRQCFAHVYSSSALCVHGSRFEGCRACLALCFACVYSSSVNHSMDHFSLLLMSWAGGRDCRGNIVIGVAPARLSLHYCIGSIVRAVLSRQYCLCNIAPAILRAKTPKFLLCDIFDEAVSTDIVSPGPTNPSPSPSCKLAGNLLPLGEIPSPAVPVRGQTGSSADGTFKS